MNQKTVLFFPLNSPGHINSSLGIADKLKQDYGYRTVFLILGPMMGNSIVKHGHELVQLEEAQPYEDYEIEDGEDPSEPVDEELMRRHGRVKRKFEGVNKWPQLIRRYQRLMKLEPCQAFINSCEIMEKYMVTELIANNDQYEKAIEKIKPDIIIIDSYYVPPFIVKQTNIPWVRLYSANPLILVQSKLPNGIRPSPMIGFKLYNKQERERMRQNEPTKWQAMLDEWQRVSDKIVQAMSKAGSLLQDFLVKYNVEPLPPGQQAHNSPHLNLYMYPEVLDYDQDDDLFEYPPRWIRCDSMMRKQLAPTESGDMKFWSEKLSKASVNKDAVIFFSLGSLASGNSEMMQKYVEMFKFDQHRLYVISKGVNGDRFKLYDSNMIGDKYIPQTFFLKHANLAIIHGGNNSITECMYYGIPMIVLPVFADQLDNAQRVEDLGFGRRLDVHKCSREELLETIDKMLHDKVLIDRMLHIGNRMQSGEDLDRVSHLLKKLIEDKKLDQSVLDDYRMKNGSS